MLKDGTGRILKIKLYRLYSIGWDLPQLSDGCAGEYLKRIPQRFGKGSREDLTLLKIWCSEEKNYDFA